MAVRILLDHGVPEENITVVVILLSRAGGIHHLCKTFPNINILTAAVDDELREMWIPHNEHDGAWRGDESELLSTDDEDEEADGSPVEQCENGESPSSLLNRGMNRARSTNLKRPESADTRGKKGASSFL